MKPYVYVASSWRNPIQPDICSILESEGIEHYDFRNPAPGDNGFHWSDIDPDWKHWGPNAYTSALRTRVANEGFAKDMDALRRATHVLLVLPCGRSAHLELGWAVERKHTAVLLDENPEPELMYKMVDVLLPYADRVVPWINATKPGAFCYDCAVGTDHDHDKEGNSIPLDGIVNAMEKEPRPHA